MIPDLVDNVLPEGLHECTIEEVADAFGRFWRSDQRIKLTTRLKKFILEARRSGNVAAVVIDGSYVTGKPEPEDIDLVVALKPDVDLDRELTPLEYKIQSKRVVKSEYRFDIYAVPDGSVDYNKLVEFFMRVRKDDPSQTTNRASKGLLRIPL